MIYRISTIKSPTKIRAKAPLNHGFQPCPFYKAPLEDVDLVQDPVAKPNMRGPSKRGAGAFFDSKVTQVRRRKIARMKGE